MLVSFVRQSCKCQPQCEEARKSLERASTTLASALGVLSYGILQVVVHIALHTIVLNYCDWEREIRLLMHILHDLNTRDNQR